MVRKLDITFWVMVVLIFALGTVGSISFKSGTNMLGTIDYRRLGEVGMSVTHQERCVSHQTLDRQRPQLFFSYRQILR